jgi:hypothetical protein
MIKAEVTVYLQVAKARTFGCAEGSHFKDCLSEPTSFFFLYIRLPVSVLPRF